LRSSQNELSLEEKLGKAMPSEPFWSSKESEPFQKPKESGLHFWRSRLQLQFFLHQFSINLRLAFHFLNKCAF